MQCPGCQVHLCWVCLAAFKTSGLCYGHMSEKHGGWGLDADAEYEDDEDGDDEESEEDEEEGDVREMLFPPEGMDFNEWLQLNAEERERYGDRQDVQFWDLGDNRLR
jgi:hypothetical protein